MTNRVDISSYSASTEEPAPSTEEPAPTTADAPQAMSDAAARPAPSTVLLDTQTPTEKSSPVQSSPSPTGSISAPASALSYDAPHAVPATPPITDIGLASKPTAVDGEQSIRNKANDDVVMSDLSHGSPTASISMIRPASPPPSDAPGVAATPPITDIRLASEPMAVGREQLNQNKGNDDVVMSDPPSLVQKPQNDVNLPPWLVPMIGYLRGVATDTAWQNLVTEFVEFEKGDPPSGVSILFFADIETNGFIHVHRSSPRSVDPRRSPTGYEARRKMSYRQSCLLNLANVSWSGGQCYSPTGRKAIMKDLSCSAAMFRSAKLGKE